MEEYIFNCYKKWLKEEYGGVLKQLSQLTKLANILIRLLVAALVVMLTTYVLSLLEILNEGWFLGSTLVEFIICVISYVYTSKYEIYHSDVALNERRHYCKKLSNMLEGNKITNHTFLVEIIERYKVVIDNYNKKVERSHDRINNALQILIVPIFLAVLSGILNTQTDVESAFTAGIATFFGITLLYLIGYFAVFMYNNIAIMKRQNSYKQFITDLQSILDFELCEGDMGSNDHITTSTGATPENDELQPQTIR